MMDSEQYHSSNLHINEKRLFLEVLKDKSVDPILATITEVFFESLRKVLRNFKIFGRMPNSKQLDLWSKFVKGIGTKSDRITLILCLEDRFLTQDATCNGTLGALYVDVSCAQISETFEKRQLNRYKNMLANNNHPSCNRIPKLWPKEYLDN